VGVGGIGGRRCLLWYYFLVFSGYRFSRFWGLQCDWFIGLRSEGDERLILSSGEEVKSQG